MPRRKKSSNKATAEGKARGGGGKFQKEPCGDKPDFKAQPTALEELLVAFGTKPLSPDVSPFQTTFSGLWGSFSYVSGELPHVNTVKQFNVVKV
jgi:hypothetical protein